MQVLVMQEHEIIPVKFADGAGSSISLFRSRQEDALVVLVIFPAMGVKGSYYKNAAQHFAAHHLHVVTIDHRGHGTSSVKPSRTSNFGYRDQVEVEYPLILEQVKLLFPNCKLVIMGHSLGGQMGSMFISRYQHLADGIILNASCSPYYKGWGVGAGFGLWLFARFIRMVTALLGYYPGNRIGFGGREAAGIMRDWCYTVATGKFAAHGSGFNYETAMHLSAKPVLGITYEGDTSAPPEALNFLLNKFKASKVQFSHILPQANEKKFNHYSWAKKPSICDGVINEWLKML
jgi:predicted alpha/beta hydrolase